MRSCSDEDFAHWAFGKDMWDDFMQYKIHPIDLMNEWNKRHGNLLRLEPHETIYSSMAKMKNFYSEK
jgi:hypothetical protein